MIGNILLGLAVGASIAATVTSVLLHKRLEKLNQDILQLDRNITSLATGLVTMHQEALDATNNIAKKAGDAVKKEVYNMAFTGIKMWR